MGCLIGIVRLFVAAAAGFAAFWIFELVIFASLDGIILPFLGSALGATVVMVFIFGATKEIARRFNRPPLAVRCGNCNGVGWVKVPAVDTSGRARGSLSVSCPVCHMTGRRPGA